MALLASPDASIRGGGGGTTKNLAPVMPCEADRYLWRDPLCRKQQGIQAIVGNQLNNPYHA